MTVSIAWALVLCLVSGLLVYVLQEARRSAAESGLQRQLLAQQQWLEQQTLLMHEKISATAARLLEEKSRSFSEVNKRELDHLISPFKEQLAEFRRRIDDIYANDTRDRIELREKIQSLTALNESVAQQALHLTNALTISSKSTGTWGEVILQRVLEDAGLREGREYRLQVSISGAAGDQQRPDAVLFLPDDRQLVIDSKVSNKSWVDYCEAPDAPRRALALAAHVASIRAHLKGLAKRDYARSPDLKTADFVLMFVPVEAALLTALSSDFSLYGEAYRAGIIFVTPTTLLAVARLVEGLWTVEKRQRSADEIAESARKLYEKLVNFSESFVAIGGSLDEARLAFNKARGQLAEGPGNAVRLAEGLKELGVRPAAGKSFPPQLLSGNREEDVP